MEEKIDIQKDCLTCEYLDAGEMLCTNEFSRHKGEHVAYEDGCDAWSLDDLVKKIYECV